MKKAIYSIAVPLLLVSCNGDGTATGSRAEARDSTETNTVSQERQHPNPQPVATFSEKVTSETGRLNNWKFAVALYETNKTFTYRMQIQYAEIAITDSLQLPDLGVAPKPVLQKGKDNYLCIVGFMDNKNVFREYKSVAVIKGNVRIHTLKYYSVSRTTTVQ